MCTASGGKLILYFIYNNIIFVQRKWGLRMIEVFTYESSHSGEQLHRRKCSKRLPLSRRGKVSFDWFSGPVFKAGSFVCQTIALTNWAIRNVDRSLFSKLNIPNDWLPTIVGHPRAATTYRLNLHKLNRINWYYRLRVSGQVTRDEDIRNYC